MTSRVLSCMATDCSANVSLVLFFKAPHHAKRRLAAEIGELASTAAKLLCDCALQDVDDWRGTSWLSPAGEEDQVWLASRPGRSLPMITQRGVNLGERINYVDAALRAKGASRIIYIGADCPGIDADYLLEAAARLYEHDAVVGPARDGGVVLMGARRAWPELRDLRWSTDRLHDDLSALCDQAGWTTARLGVRSDIDTVADLLAVRDELVDDTRATRRDLAEWISANGNRLSGGKLEAPGAERSAAD